MLDLSANRCLADRTNAWTATDHTCYTVYTAGSDGFASILPIYLDHILYPLLRDEDFITEVHHINDEGEDAGVVYSEMQVLLLHSMCTFTICVQCLLQGVENTSGNLLYFSMLDLLYPGPCSYQVQTGGKLKNLRKNTTNEKVSADRVGTRLYVKIALGELFRGQEYLFSTDSTVFFFKKKMSLHGRQELLSCLGENRTATLIYAII